MHQSFVQLLPCERLQLDNSHYDRRNPPSLDWLNFFLADVRDGLAPYLAIYLLAVHKWSRPASVW